MDGTNVLATRGLGPGKGRGGKGGPSHSRRRRCCKAMRKTGKASTMQAHVHSGSNSCFLFNGSDFFFFFCTNDDDQNQTNSRMSIMALGLRQEDAKR